MPKTRISFEAQAAWKRSGSPPQPFHDWLDGELAELALLRGQLPKEQPKSVREISNAVLQTPLAGLRVLPLDLDEGFTCNVSRYHSVTRCR